MRVTCLISCSFAVLALTSSTYAQDSPTPAIVRDAIQHELDSYRPHTWGLEYRVHRVDSKDDSIREVIESADGNVSRTLTWKGRALTRQCA